MKFFSVYVKVSIRLRFHKLCESRPSVPVLSVTPPLPVLGFLEARGAKKIEWKSQKMECLRQKEVPYNSLVITTVMLSVPPALAG
jgi:hypothetical protein